MEVKAHLLVRIPCSTACVTCREKCCVTSFVTDWRIRHIITATIFIALSGEVIAARN